MPSVPTPLKVVLGIAATAAEEARKLPETLPTAMAGAPMIAVSTAMQASLRVQQHIAALAARGEEVLAQLRGTSDEPPAWATFDDPKPDDLAAGRVSDKAAGKSASAGSDTPLRAAFDRIDYEGTGYAEADEHHDRIRGRTGGRLGRGVPGQESRCEKGTCEAARGQARSSGDAYREGGRRQVRPDQCRGRTCGRRSRRAGQKGDRPQGKRQQGERQQGERQQGRRQQDSGEQGTRQEGSGQ
jgi:hypothetical protein